MFFKGFCLILEGYEEIEIIIEVNSGVEFFFVLGEKVFDVVLFDLKMLGMDGIEVVECLKVFYLEVKIILLIMYDDECFI